MICFLGGSVVKNLPANTGDVGLIPGPGRSHMSRNNETPVPQLLSLSSESREATAMRSPSTTIRKWILLSATGESPVQPKINK